MERYYSNKILRCQNNITTLIVSELRKNDLKCTARTTNIVIKPETSSTFITGFASVRGGMIRLVVKEIAQREGIENPNVLSQETGLPYETCRRLWQEKATMLGLSTIERLCDVLHVRPGQLFDYEYEADKARQPYRTRGKTKK